MTTVQAIETVYRGYRFRSRLEARWAVFFDAAGIEWVYEPEGYTVDGVWYLPDFWLPKLNCFAENKPNKEEIEPIKQTLWTLAKSRNCGAIIIVGQPNAEKWPVRVLSESRDRLHLSLMDWVQCLFCGQITFRGGVWPCSCLTHARILEYPKGPTKKIEFALSVAQQARFEHGEKPYLGPYRAPPKLLQDVYVAGSVLEDREGEEIIDGKTIQYAWPEICAWRLALGVQMPDHKESTKGQRLSGRFFYAGPTIVSIHGEAVEGVPCRCVEEVREADTMFVWIDTTDTRGTLIEIGVAYGRGIPIFVAFANEQLSRDYYFARELASLAIVCDDAVKAWKLFQQWQDQADFSPGKTTSRAEQSGRNGWSLTPERQRVLPAPSADEP